MNERLPEILGSIDSRFLDYLDEDGEMLPATVTTLLTCTNALLSGSMTPAVVAEDWADFYDLLPAFVAEYAPLSVGDLEGEAEFLIGAVVGHALLTEDDVTYLMAVEPVFAMYTEVGANEE